MTKEAKRLFTLDGREAESIWAAIWLAAAEYEAGRMGESYLQFAVIAAREAGAAVVS